MKLLGLSAALHEADFLAAHVYGIGKAMPKMNPLQPQGFDAYVLHILELVMRTVAPVESVAIKGFLSTLYRQWGGLTAAQRSKAIQDAQKSYLSHMQLTPPLVVGALEQAGPGLVGDTKKAISSRFGFELQPSLNVVDQVAVHHLARSQVLYMTFQNGERAEHLGGMARGIVAAGLEKGHDPKTIQKALEKQIPPEALGRSRSYHQMIASVFTAKAKTFSTLSSFQEAGIAAYQVEEIGDEVTCNVCRFMDGRVFPVAPAVEKYEQSSQLQDPRDVKEVQPWMSVAKDPNDPDGRKAIFFSQGGKKHLVAHVDQSAEGKVGQKGRFTSKMSARQMSARGVATPPYHARCRGSLVPVFGAPDRPEPADVTQEEEDAEPSTPAIMAQTEVVSYPPANLPANLAELVRPLPKHRDFETPGRAANPLKAAFLKVDALPSAGNPEYGLLPFVLAPKSSVGLTTNPLPKIAPATMTAAKKKDPQLVPVALVGHPTKPFPVMHKGMMKQVLSGEEPTLGQFAPKTPIVAKLNGTYWLVPQKAYSQNNAQEMAAAVAVVKGDHLSAHVIDLDAKLAKPPPKPKKPKAPKQAPAPAPMPVVKPTEPPKLGSAENILHQKDGAQRGSNDGGFFIGKDGVRRYVKFYDDPTQAQSEHLANQLYRDLGLPAPESELFEHNGKLAYASKIIEGGKTLQEVGLTQQNAKKVLEGFHVDVLTGNWDAVGLGHDNAMVVPGGGVARIDNGGTFLFRAKEGRKPQAALNAITEWEVFFSSKNPAYSKVATKAGVEGPEDMAATVVEGVSKIKALRDASGGWANYVDRIAPQLVKVDRDAIVKMLEERTKLLEQKVGDLTKPKPPPPKPGEARYLAQQYSTQLPKKGLKMSDLPEAKHLLKNENYGGDADVLPGGERKADYQKRVRKAVADVPEESKSAIRLFTGSAYRSIRESESEGRPSRTAKQIHEAFKHATPEPGTVWRGIENLSKSVVERYLHGKERFSLGKNDTNGTSSSSWKIDISVNKFMSGPRDSYGDSWKILFKMNARTAIPIETISTFNEASGSNEYERMLRHDSVWKITGLSRMPGTERVLIVEADEVDG